MAGDREDCSWCWVQWNSSQWRIIVENELEFVSEWTVIMSLWMVLKSIRMVSRGKDSYFDFKPSFVLS